MVFCFAGDKLIEFDKKASLSVPEKKYFPSYYEGPATENHARRTLEQGSALVVFGSSEMSLDKLPSIPFNFFNNTLHIPCIGLGHAGNQCMSIFAQLCSIREGLKKAKVVIILSPGWFTEYGKAGTSLESFLEFNNERFLYNAYYNSNIPDDFKNYIGEYLSGKMSEIESPSAIIKTFNYKYLASRNAVDNIVYAPYVKAYEAYCNYKVGETNKLYSEDKYESPLIAETSKAAELRLSVIRINWDSLYKVALDTFAVNSTSNNMGVSDVYYNKFMGKREVRRVYELPMQDNREYKDFTMLLKLLKYYNVDAYFIMQPLNPYVYVNLKEIKPAVDTVLQGLHNEGYSCFSMFTTDSNRYVKGTLNDVMHFGNLGWYRADSAIYEHFTNHKQ